jgi:hypothetical protein
MRHWLPLVAIAQAFRALKINPATPKVALTQAINAL